jgi:hypothetical protein
MKRENKTIALKQNKLARKRREIQIIFLTLPLNLSLTKYTDHLKNNENDNDKTSSAFPILQHFDYSFIKSYMNTFQVWILEN